MSPFALRNQNFSCEFQTPCVRLPPWYLHFGFINLKMSTTQLSIFLLEHVFHWQTFPISGNGTIVHQVANVRNREVSPDSFLHLYFPHPLYQWVSVDFISQLSSILPSSCLHCSFCDTLSPLAWIMKTAFLLVSCSSLLLLPDTEWYYHTPPINVSVALFYTLWGKGLTPCLGPQTECNCIYLCPTSLCIPLLITPHSFSAPLSYGFCKVSNLSSPEAWYKSHSFCMDCSFFYLVGFSSFLSPNLQYTCDLYRETFSGRLI